MQMTTRNPVIAVLIVLAVCLANQLARAEEGVAGDRYQVAGEGSVRDAETGLHWTTSDNQDDIDWHTATAYCRELELDQSADWRLPTIEELKAIFDWGGWRGPRSLRMSRSSSWSSTQDGSSSAFFFDFNSGSQRSSALESVNDMRALCVRDTAKQAE